jgi:hypothetical protein
MMYVQEQGRATPPPSLGARVRAIVGVRHRGRKIGLYRVRRVDDAMIVLSHGVISFPVGTRLVLEDFQGLIPGAPRGCLSTVVVGNDLNGISLTW